MLRKILAPAFIVTLVFSEALAQQPPTMWPGRLTVRPHEMVIGTRTTVAGLHPLPGFANYLLYVPKQCVGTKRAPLFVLIHGGGRSGQMEAEKFQSLADKYGVIVLYPTSPTGHWQLPDDLSQLHAIDSSIKVVLRTNAIDPDRLALLGFSEGGYSSLVLGLNNQDIFSRVAPMSFLGLEDRKGPTNPKTHFLVSGGIAEDMIRESVRAGQILRHDGNPVVTILGLRAHVDYVEDEDFVWSWILKSWDDPALTTRITTGRVPADSDPILTVDALNKMTVFWTKFQQEPDSVHDVARMAHQEQLPLSLGAEPVFVISMNITDMAAKYPSVAADLHAAGLTAQQEAEYRAAILRVGFVRASGIAPGGPPASGDQRQHTPYAPIAPTSVLGKNLAFRRAHAAEFQALARTGMWTTQ